MPSNYTPIKTLHDYKVEKIDILKEMAIYLTTSEVQHLMSLEREIEVDQYARTIIMSKL